jgi:hypothetical protein
VGAVGGMLGFGRGLESLVTWGEDVLRYVYFFGGGMRDALKLE